MEKTTPNMGAVLREYFRSPKNIYHKQYEALRAFFYEGAEAKTVSQKFGYTTSSFYSLVRDFKGRLQKTVNEGGPFFQIPKIGRKEKDTQGKITELVVTLRKQYLSVPEIKTLLDTQKMKVSERHIFSIVKKEGFVRLPRRDRKTREESQRDVREKITAPPSEKISLEPETFNSQNIGILCLMACIKGYEIDTILKESSYPETKTIDKVSSLLSFVALKLSNIRRYSADDLWCMDRGLGLFAGLNVLPKTAWFSSYSDRVTRQMNVEFLKKLHNLWEREGLLSDTMNLDFTAVPYWGDDNHLENNWSGKRHIALASMLAVLGQDPDSGIIDYGDMNVRHENKSDCVLEFVDFYRSDKQSNHGPRYLVFDNKFTTHQNLRQLDDRGIKFVTIRRRGKNIVDQLEKLPSGGWKKIHVMNADGKGRTLRVFEQRLPLGDYGKGIRQVAITGHGKIKPALVISNDFDIALEELIRKYSRRWIVEKEISEQIEFFHLNRISSSMVIKVDFDLTMTILAHNLYRVFASELSGYSHQADQAIYEKFLCNGGEVEIAHESIEVRLKKKRNLPGLLTVLEQYQGQEIPWLDNRKLTFVGASTA